MRAGLFFPPQPRSVPSTSLKAGSASETVTDIARLTSRMAAQDEAAYREFYELYFNRLLRYLLVLAGGREETARDVLQATLLRVVRHARRFESEEAFWSWLTVLARSSMVDSARKHKRYFALLDRFFQSRAPAPPGPDGEADDRLMSLLEKNLHMLSPEERALIERKYMKGESVREIAADDGVTEKAIESRLLRIQPVKNRRAE